MALLQLQKHNYSTAATRRGRVLLHVPTTSVFELDHVADALLELFENQAGVSAADIRQRLDGRFSPGEVCDSLSDFIALGVVADGVKDYEIPARDVDGPALSTLILTLTTGCNLGCNYCYREDLTTPRKASVMDAETGRKAIDMLFREAGQRDQVNVVFFGGEPLTRFPLIRELVDYAEAQAGILGKKVDFSLTTNATLLSDEVIEFLGRHRFGISISMDGNELQHNRHRLTVAGKGSYKSVVQRVERLLATYTARPVGVRVTLARGNTDVERIYAHLHDEIGFHEVGFAPVTAGPESPFGLSDAEMAEVFRGMQSLGRTYVAFAKRGERHGFSNMNQMMFDLSNGTRKTLPCGAGVGLLAVGTTGKVSLCHRFTGSDFQTFGDVENGVSRPELSAFLKEAQVGNSACSTCPARRICAGGCYHEAYTRSTDPMAPTFDHCDYVRDWLAFGLECYGEIVLANPGFFGAGSNVMRTKQ